MKKLLDHLKDRDQILRLAALGVIAASVILALPSFLIPLGLPPEGDAVDYRIPLIRWMLRHGSYPNWDWSMVDDYPMLGELLMLPLYGIHPSLARLVPFVGFLGLGLAGGLLFRHVTGSGLEKRTLFLLGMAFTLTLRPLAIQSNLLMLDNFASMGFLMALYFAFERRPAISGFFAAIGLATRYTIWPMAPLLPLAFLWSSPKGEKVRKFVVFGSIAALGCLPFMIRNWIVNGNPIFPLGDEAAMSSVAASNYGRGKDILSLILLPWDLLYTNSFVEGIYDYTLGKLFYLQILACAIAWKGWALWREQEKFKKYFALAVLFTLAWFATAQQMRFLVPALVVFTLAMLIPALKLPTYLLTSLVLLSVFSSLSIQKDSVLMAVGKRDSIFADEARGAEDCFVRAGVKDSPIGYVRRDGMLGFFDRDFVFLSEHPYGLPSQFDREVSWIYTKKPREGFELWPKENPCLLRRLGT